MDSNVGSPLYQLTNPRLKAAMKASGLHMFKAQTEHDEKMRIAANKMRVFELKDTTRVIKDVFVNRDHITCISTTNGSTEIFCPNHLLSLYEEKSLKWKECMRILGLPLNDEQQDEEMSEAGPSSKQPGVNIPDLVKTRVNIQFLELTRLFIPYLVKMR